MSVEDSTLLTAAGGSGTATQAASSDCGPRAASVAEAESPAGETSSDADASPEGGDAADAAGGGSLGTSVALRSMVGGAGRLRRARRSPGGDEPSGVLAMGNPPDRGGLVRGITRPGAGSNVGIRGPA
ncbi:MAG: hypothetical protein ACJ8DX_10670 [Xanthobacteraceae bacterium]